MRAPRAPGRRPVRTEVVTILNQSSSLGPTVLAAPAVERERQRKPGCEEWRAVPGYVGTYSVSDQGRVKRLRGTPRTPRDRVLRPSLKPEGYPYVDLYGDGPRQRHHVHALVAEAFIGPRPPGYVVHHRDGRKDNNVVDYLSYVTSGENERTSAWRIRPA